MMLSSDLEFARFLTTRPLSVVWLERPWLPDSEIRARTYQEETDLILAALRSGSRARLELILTVGLAA